MNDPQPLKHAFMHDRNNADQAPGGELPLVLVTWVDAVSEDKWQKLSDAADSLAGDWVVKSVGYIVREENDSLLLGGSLGMDETVCMILKIPRGMIKTITPLVEKPADCPA